MNRGSIEKIARTQEDKLLLAKVADKIEAGMRKNILCATCFLSPRELAMARALFGKQDALREFGGYAAAERRMLVYLPAYLEESALAGKDSPVACLRAAFYEYDAPTHRDFLGALIGAGVAREAIGDICVADGSCDFFVTAQIAPFLLQAFTSAGRARLHLVQIPLCDARIPEAKTQMRRDTIPSLRLDCVVAAGFRISRAKAAQFIASGFAAVDGLPCDKPDKPVTQGAIVSVRGLGKLRLAEVGGITKKGRLGVTFENYL